MTAVLEHAQPASAETRGRALVREMGDVLDRLPRLTGGSLDELWSLYPASTGVMAYTDPDALDPQTPRVLGVPDGYARPATTRLQLLRSALWQTVYLLDDPEAEHRTGFTAIGVHDALRELFDAGERGSGAVTEDVGLARAQLAAIPWSTLPANGSPGQRVPPLLTTMLFSDDVEAAHQASSQVENLITAQCDLSPSAPGAVSVIVAAVAERDADNPHLGPVLDLLCLTLVGHTARWELEIGTRGIRAACYREAMKGYWSLRRLAASTRDPYDVRELAVELVEMLDEEAVNPQPDPLPPRLENPL